MLLTFNVKMDSIISVLLIRFHHKKSIHIRELDPKIYARWVYRTSNSGEYFRDIPKTLINVIHINMAEILRVAPLRFKTSKG